MSDGESKGNIDALQVSPWLTQFISFCCLVSYLRCWFFATGIFTITSYASGKASATSLLQGSSLGDELSRFDYSNGTDSTVSPLSASKFGDAETSKDLAETVDLEMDEFNLHECMPTLVALVQHMVDKHITPVEGQAPNWVTAIKKQLEDPKSARNVKLFLVKLMVNVESRQPYFEMFAEELYASIINMVLQFDCSEGLNYFVLDMIQMMLRWTLKHPPNELDQHHAQKLFEYVIKNIRHSNSQVCENQSCCESVVTALLMRTRLDISAR